jgi:hypothetical protein
MIFVATKIVGQQQKFSSSYGAVAGTGMEKNQDPGSGIFIPDPQHPLTRFWLRITSFSRVYIKSVFRFPWLGCIVFEILKLNF